MDQPAHTTATSTVLPSHLPPMPFLQPGGVQNMPHSPWGKPICIWETKRFFSPHSTAVSPCCVYQELTPNFPYIPLSQLLVHSYHGTEALKSVKSGVNGENRWAKGALPSSQLRNKYGLIYVGSGLMLRGTQPTFQPAENPAVTPQVGSLVPVCFGSSSPLC